MLNFWKKTVSMILCIALIFSSVQIVNAGNSITPENTSKKNVTDVFSDVNITWYTEYIQYVYENKLMIGIEGTDRFEPNNNITKAQVTQVLYNMEGQPEVSEKKVCEELKDIYGTEWYANAVSWAYDNSIVTGDLETMEFSPNADVTREQLALMMFRYASYKGYDITADSKYEDLVNADKVSNWAAEGMSWAVGSGLISGVEENGIKDLDPQGKATRAQMAAILKRFCEAFTGSIQPSPVPSDKVYTIYPIVREIAYGGTEFPVPSQVNVVYESGIDEASKAYLTEVLAERGITAKVASEPADGEFNILLGINDSKEAADTYEDALTIKTSDLYEKCDAYVLDVNESQLTIVGKDSDAVYRGVATLKMMLSSFDQDEDVKENILLESQIEDYAGIEFRGFIEGFYGGWDYETRAELMEFARDLKMNMYVYASKTDAYHTNRWADLYPEDEIKQIEELVKTGEKAKCYYVWSVHLGSFFNGLDIETNPSLYETRYNQLVAKLTQLYDVGVRKFDILNDDFGSGSHADVVTVLNRLTKEFIEPKGCKPITYCPQGYNKSWSGDGTELNALTDLDDSIILYWTGDDVNSPITQSTVDYVAEKTGQPVSFWLNYPVNEHAKSGVFLGNIDHYARDGVTGLTAAVSNPSRFGQSNKAALFQLASLFWNNSDYSKYSEDIWLDSFNYLEEGVEEAYRTIGRNVANCPGSSRVSAGFPESEYIKENLENVLTAVGNGEAIMDLEDTAILLEEFDNILAAVETFRKDCKNEKLAAELDPWLKSLTGVTTAAKGAIESIIALEENNPADAWTNFAAASQGLKEWNAYPTCDDPSITQRALAGSKRIQPFAADMISYAEGTLTPIFDANYSGQNLIAVLGGQKRSMDDNAAKMFDGDLATAAQWNVVQQKDDYFGVDLGVVKKVTDIRIVQGNTDADHDYFHKAVLEYSEDGKTYTQIGEQYNDTVLIELDELNIRARYVRLRLAETGTASKPDFWTHIREFTVNEVKPDGNRVYTNVEKYAKQPLTIEGNQYYLANMQNVTLKKGEYLGIKFSSPVYVSNLITELSNYTNLECKTNWEASAEYPGLYILKSIWFENNTDSAVTVDVEKFGVVVENVKADPKFLETNLTNGIQQGSWENVFDGDESTYVWTNEGQTAGDYITFDFGAVIDLYDLEIVTHDGNPRFYNAQIQISTDKENWTKVAEVKNDNSVFEVPYRYVRANANGQEARYLRILITGNTGYYLRIHEIFFNQTVETVDETAVIKASFGEDIEKAIDGNLSTIFSGKAGAEDSIEYKFTDVTNFHAISILQDPNKISNAKVSILRGDIYEEIGKLDESAKKFELNSEISINGLKITFEGETEISLYEIYLDEDKAVSDDIGEYVDPIIVQPSVEVVTPSNIALQKDVSVSGTSDGDKANVNDGDLDTKWDSQPIKTGTGDAAQDIGDAWVVIDLGAVKTNIFNAMQISYYNKVYPTIMEIQISNDGNNWVTVKELTRTHDGQTFPVVTENYETAYTARYVRLYFSEINNVAAGNGVGVKEWEITGVSLSSMELKSVEAAEDVKVAAGTAAEDVELPAFVKVFLGKEGADDQEVLVPVNWNMENYDASTARTCEIKGTLDFPQSVITDTAEIAINVVVE